MAGAWRDTTAAWRAIIAAALVLSALFATQQVAVAAEPPAVAVVFDASGSMWGNLPGSKLPKHALAREALRQSFALQSAAKPTVGVALFGGQGRDCSAADMLAPLAPYSETGIIEPLERLNPRGRGPLALGLETAAAALAQAKGPRSILVVHDGADNCGRDVCTTLETIAKSTPGLTVHAVGIALKPEERETLACVTKLTNGRRFSAETPEELTRAMAEAVTAALGAVRPPAPVAANARGTTGGDIAQPLDDAALRSPFHGTGRNLTAGVTQAAGQSKLHLAAIASSPGRAITEGLVWSIQPVGGGDSEAIIQSSAATPSLKLAPGRYRIEIEAGLVRHENEVEIAPDRETRAVIDLKAGAVVVTAGLGPKPEPLVKSAMMTIISTAQERDAAPIYAGPLPSHPLLIAPGRYQVQVLAGLLSRDEIFDVSQGALARVRVALNGAELQLTMGKPATALTDPALMIVERDSAVSGNPPVEVARSAAPTAQFLLPAGSYTLVGRSGAVTTRQLVSIASGELAQRTLNIEPSTLDVRVLIGGAPPRTSLPIVVSVTPFAGDISAATRRIVGHGVNPQFIVGGGSYQIEARIQGYDFVASSQVTVTAGQSRNVTLEIGAGEVTVRLPAAEAATGSPTVFAEIRNDRGDLIWRALGSAPTSALLAPGSYSIRAGSAKTMRHAQFTVASGQRLAVDLSR